MYLTEAGTVKEQIVSSRENDDEDSKITQIIAQIGKKFLEKQLK
jgi:hypothetical protein